MNNTTPGPQEATGFGAAQGYDLNDAHPQRPGHTPWLVEREYDADELSERLADRAAEWVPQLFPNGRLAGDEWRLADINGAGPRKNGSCTIQTKGAKAGCWWDHSTNKGGKPLSTLKMGTGLSGRALLERAAEIVGAAKPKANGKANGHDRDRHNDKAREIDFILNGCLPAAGSLVENYLKGRRLELPDCGDLLYHPLLTDWQGKRGRPAMVVIVRRPDTGEKTGGLWRTYLTDDGSSKAEMPKAKMGLGPCAGGVAMLMSMSDDGELGIGEGIETSLAGAKIFNVPVWAALSAGNMRKMQLPPGLKKLLIFADRGDGGQSAAAELRQRAMNAGIDVEVYLPHSEGDGADFNDDLMRGLADTPYTPGSPEQPASSSGAAVEPEILPPAPTLEELVVSARTLTRDNDPASIDKMQTVVRQLALADLDPIEKEQVLSIVKEQTGRRIAVLREALKAYTPKHRAISVFASARQLNIGSDIEMAERVAADLHQQSGEIAFADGEFWRYSGTHWEVIEHQGARRAVHRYDGAEFMTPGGFPEVVKLSKSRVDSVLHEMGAKLAQPDFFAKAPPGINCASGFIAFGANGKPILQPHDPGHRCRHALPGHWRPGDLDPENPPPDSLLGRLLNGIFEGDVDAQDKRKLAAEIAGAATVGYGPKLRQPKAIVLVGETAENGKSQVLDAIRGLLPASAVASVSASKFGDERFIVGLRGKLLNATDELSGTAIASDTFKAVITGEPVSGRDVYRSAMEFRPVAQQIFATNRLPKFTGGMDRGVQRRLLPISFNRVIPEAERVENIGQRIGHEEPDLLLAFAVAGADRLIRQRGFTIPKSSKDALQQWLYRDNAVLAWVQARVDPAPAPKPGEKVFGLKSSYAHSLFRDWTRAAGFAEHSIPDVNGFVQQLKENQVVPGIHVRHTRSGNWLVGLTVRPTDRSAAEDGIEEVNPLAGAGIDVN